VMQKVVSPSTVTDFERIDHISSRATSRIAMLNLGESKKIRRA
jgi:hypothetical protein